MRNRSPLFITAAMLALSGCTSIQPTGRLPPIPSQSDANIFPSGAISSDASEVSKRPSDLPSMNGAGTTGSLRARR